MALVDLTSGGSPTFVLGPAPALPADTRSAGDATGALVARLEAASGLAVVAITPTAAEAKRHALELARTATGRANVVACRGTPVEPGFRLVSHGDGLQVGRAFRQDRPAAIVLEVVQGSHNASVPPPKYVQRVRDACDEHGVWFVADESTCGLARTGALFAHEREKVKPDVIALSLHVARDVDGGVVLARRELGLRPEIAASPAAAHTLGVLDVIERDKLVGHVKAAGKHLQDRLHAILETRRRWVMDTRGRGLVHALSLWDDPTPVIEAARGRGLALARTGINGLLFTPPLTTTTAELDETLAVVDELLSDR